MINALVIKNANFLANKVTTITFLKPCTAIEFDEDRVTLDGLGAVTVGYTKTPSDTTDPVVFSSADSSIISTDGTTLIVNGIGTTTLTVSCGSYSDTCSVTVDIYESPVYVIGTMSTLSAQTLGQEHSGVIISGNSKWKLSCVGSFADGHFEYPFSYNITSAGFDVGEITAIKIPQNTDKIHIHCENLSTTDTTIAFIDGNDQYQHNNLYYAPVLSSVLLPRTSPLILDTDVAVPAGCDGYIITFETASVIPDSVSSESALKEYAETTAKLSIHYLPDSNN